MKQTAEQQQGRSGRKPGGDAPSMDGHPGLAEHLQSRYGGSSIVGRMTETVSRAESVSRLSRSRLPLLADLQRRWARAGPSWPRDPASFPLVQPLPWIGRPAAPATIGHLAPAWPQARSDMAAQAAIPSSPKMTARASPVPRTPAAEAPADRAAQGTPGARIAGPRLGRQIVQRHLGLPRAGMSGPKLESGPSALAASQQNPGVVLVRRHQSIQPRMSRQNTAQPPPGAQLAGRPIAVESRHSDAEPRSPGVSPLQLPMARLPASMVGRASDRPLSPPTAPRRLEQAVSNLQAESSRLVVPAQRLEGPGPAAQRGGSPMAANFVQRHLSPPTSRTVLRPVNSSPATGPAAGPTPAPATEAVPRGSPSFPVNMVRRHASLPVAQTGQGSEQPAEAAVPASRPAVVVHPLPGHDLLGRSQIQTSIGLPISHAGQRRVGSSETMQVARYQRAMTDQPGMPRIAHPVDVPLLRSVRSVPTTVAGPQADLANFAARRVQRLLRYSSPPLMMRSPGALPGVARPHFGFSRALVRGLQSLEAPSPLPTIGLRPSILRAVDEGTLPTATSRVVVRPAASSSIAVLPGQPMVSASPAGPALTGQENGGTRPRAMLLTAPQIGAGPINQVARVSYAARAHATDMELLSRRSRSSDDGDRSGFPQVMPSGQSERLAMQPMASGASAPLAADTAPAASSAPAAQPPSPNATRSSMEGLDLERIADEIYRILERRLIVERESLGL